MEAQPSPALIREAMDRLQSAYERDGGKLDMDAGNVRRGPYCKTVACFAGWYARAVLLERTFWTRGRLASRPECNEVLRHSHISRDVDYLDGALRFAEDIGVEALHPPAALRGWADRHKDLWGNRHGWDIFRKPVAYMPEGSVPGPVIGMMEVIEWWRGVADRIDAAQA